MRAQRWARVVASVRSAPLATWALAAAAVLFVVTFVPLVWLRHARYTTFDFDLGIHDQSIWLLSRWKSFCTVRGLPVFGHHATFAYVLLVPFYWLGAGAQFLDLCQVLACAAGVVPLYALARDRLGPRRDGLAAALAATWLLQAPLQFFVWETFHPEVMALPALLAGYVAGERRAWGWCAGWLLLAVAWKEDVALAVVGLGLVWLLRRRWKPGLVLAGAGSLWFVVFGMVVVPALAGGGTVYGPLYGGLGDTPSEVVRTAVEDPSAVLERLDDNDAVGYGRDLLAPMAFASLAAPAALLIGLPQAVVNLLSTATFTFDLRYHYAALPLAASALAMVEGVARLVRRWPRARFGFVGVVVLAAMGTTITWGVSPIGDRYRDGYWPLEPRPQVAAYEAAMDLVGGSAGLSADYNVIPHVTHRDVAYTFPNPWVVRNYGIDGRRGDPALVDWIVVARATASPTDQEVLARLLATGEFVVRLERDGVVAAQRTRP